MDRYSITIEALEEKADEEFVDPETAKVGHARRPMILTHSVMVGLGLILLIAVESLIISKVSSTKDTGYRSCELTTNVDRPLQNANLTNGTYV